MAIALGGLAITHPVGSVLAQEVKRQPTPEQVMGPFYPVLKPLDEDADLTTIRGKRGHAQGKVIHLMGRVLNSRGEPVRGAKLEIWQANTQGRYAHPADIINSWGFRLDGGGCMNDNQFMGLRIRFEGGG